MRDVSIIIPSFNTRDITRECLDSLVASIDRSSKPLRYDIIVVDNASSDGSPDMLKQYKRNFHHDRITMTVIYNDTNYGYSKGNNIGLKAATGTYILYLNSDVIVSKVDFAELVARLDRDPDIGGLTVRVNLTDGSIDPASHRGFPTIWRSITYFTGIERTMGRVRAFQKLVGGYHLLHLDLNTEHEIDSATGAFFMTRKHILDQLGGFDEDFFMYGEDLDLCYRIKEQGYKILYLPDYSIIHLKYKSGLSSASDVVRTKTRRHFHEAMRLFYRKHYEQKHPAFINFFIYSLITLRNHIS